MRGATGVSTFFLFLPLVVGCAGTGDGEDESSPLDIFGSGTADSISSDLDDRVMDIPFYFGMPMDAVIEPIDRPSYPQPTLWNPSDGGDDLGLRVIAVKQGPTLANRKSARRSMATTLGPAKVLQTGDIVLSFRPELAGTMAYPHIQQGITHAGLVIADEDGVVFNIDSPLDADHMGQFDAKHYAGKLDEDGNVEGGTHALHVIRPRIMDDERRARLQDWAAMLDSRLTDINGERKQIKFQSDYLMPTYVSHDQTPRQMVTTLGKIILEDDTETTMPMYCSEFAWHMLALSACTEAEILAAPEEGAACVDPPFDPMPLIAQTEDEIGITDGPLNALLALPSEERENALPHIFADGDATGLSSGHRDVAESVAPLMGPLSQYYQARIGGASVTDLAEMAAAIGADFAANYSPTAYFLAAMGDELSRPMDYVVTVAFVDDDGFAKARDLARLPVP